MNWSFQPLIPLGAATDRQGIFFFFEFQVPDPVANPEPAATEFTEAAKYVSYVTHHLILNNGK